MRSRTLRNIFRNKCSFDMRARPLVRAHSKRETELNSNKRRTRYAVHIRYYLTPAHSFYARLHNDSTKNSRLELHDRQTETILDVTNYKNVQEYYRKLTRLNCDVGDVLIKRSKKINTQRDRMGRPRRRHSTASNTQTRACSIFAGKSAHLQCGLELQLPRATHPIGKIGGFTGWFVSPQRWLVSKIVLTRLLRSPFAIVLSAHVRLTHRSTAK